MSSLGENNDFYYSGGLAEFVSKPSPLTLSFFSHWFMGSTSLGNAMKIVGLPYENVSLPIVELHNGETMMNLKNEEKTLYAKTIFSYGKQTNTDMTPILKINYSKAYHPIYLLNTAKIAKKQSEWIAFPDKSVTFAQSLLKVHQQPADTIQELDKQLINSIWPTVLVIGMLCEFYSQVLENKYSHLHNWYSIQKFINIKVSEKDWFFHSILDQKKVKEGSMSFESYISEYGNRSDKDYELTAPRWSEIVEEMQKRIIHEEINKTHNETVLPTNVDAALVNAYISLLILRSEAKKYVLAYIAALRTCILASVHTHDISLLNRSRILQGDFSPQKHYQKQENAPPTPTKKTEGMGKGISSGNAQGITYIIKDNTAEVPQNCICVFPNASPEYSLLYPKCKGIIFLKGGQTSHGAIVAREFGIPALMDPSVEEVEGTICTIDGSTGQWKITTK